MTPLAVGALCLCYCLAVQGLKTVSAASLMSIHPTHPNPQGLTLLTLSAGVSSLKPPPGEPPTSTQTGVFWAAMVRSELPAAA